MSFNQSRAEKNDSHFKNNKPNRSGSSGNQRNFSGGGGGGGKGGGGGSAPPQPSSSAAPSNNSSLSSNRSFKKSGNGQGGQGRGSGPNVNSESNVGAPRAVQNGAHLQQQQPPLHGPSDAQAASVAGKPMNAPGSRNNRAVPKAPPTQTTGGASESAAPTTPAKGDSSNAFALQFGTISPGFINGMQIPARTSSAPPNLDEQKRDQARHDSSGALPAVPIPSVPKQQLPRKEPSKMSHSNVGESNLPPQTKRDVHTQGPTGSSTGGNQKPAALPVTGMPLSFQQPQVPMPFGAPNPQIPTQGVTATSLQMPMPLPLGNASQMQQPVFVQGLQSHPLQPQGMIHQGQNLGFAPQIGHQMAPQMGNLPMGMNPQFSPQQTGKFGSQRKAVKITHPETHEELKLDKSYLDGGSAGPRSHPSAPPQSQPVPSFTPSHPINYYPSMQGNSYNPSNMFLTNTQMASSSQPSRYNYPGTQNPQAMSFMNPPPISTLPVTKVGPQVHAEDGHNPHVAVGSATSGPIEVTVRPAVGSRGEKVGSSSIIVSSPPTLKNDFLKPTKDTNTFHSPKDSVSVTANSVQQTKPVLESVGAGLPSATAKLTSPASVAVAVQKQLGTSTPDEAATSMANGEGRKRETVRRSDSFKDQKKKLNQKDVRETQLQHPDNASVAVVKPLSSGMSSELSPSDMVVASTSISSLNPNVDSLKHGGSEIVEGHDASEVKDSVRTGEVPTCEPENMSDPKFEGTVSHNALHEVQLKEDNSGIVKHNFDKPGESPNTEHLDRISSDLEGISVGSEIPGVKPEHVIEKETVSCNSEVNGTIDSIIRSDSAETENSASVPHMLSSNTADGQDVSLNESGILHQGEAPVLSSFTSEVNGEPEGKGADSSSSGSVSSSGLGVKDKPSSEPNKVKGAATKVKKKRKDILKAADAAGSNSDLYNAYKGPEEKQELALSSDSDLKQAAVDDEKDTAVSVESPQGKGEPDDWEDAAADISTPKLKASGDGKEVGGDGNVGRKYSRDFLLTLAEHCTDLPVNFEIGSDIADALMSVPVGVSHHSDRESYPNSGRIVDRPSGGARSGRGGGMLDDDKWAKSPGPYSSGRDPRLDMSHGGAVAGFRPGQGGNHGVLRNPRGHPSGQYVGGILSGPMQAMVSQGGMQRNHPDADRWQRATGFQKGLIPSPQTPLQVMHRAERKYEIGKVSDEEQAKQRQLKAVLNKLTPQNFEKLFEQVKEVNIDNTITLSGVISQIFDKALMEPTFCEMYANFCFHLSGALPDFSEDNEKITFKRLLLNKCQEEFERGEREQAEADRMEEEGEIKRSDEEREERRIQARRRMLGNIRLIGELYKKRMLTERIMHECITKLLGQYQNPDEEDVEALCKLMSTIGEMIDHAKAKEHMDAYFDMMLKLSNNMKLSSRVRFMLKDAIDLRKNKWRQRRKVEGPKKIDEVHRDAAQERQAQTSRLARGPSMNNSSRRGQPLDFGPRGSNMSSPHSQMGGARGLPSQARGFGGQDARFEERHPYESRTLSVPLSQRPIDDDSITLGPQGGLARGMSIRGQPLISSVPLVDISPGPGDSRRLMAGPNGYNPVAGRHYDSREELAPRYVPERFMGSPAYDQSNSNERPPLFGNRDLRPVDPSLDRSTAPSPPVRVQGSSAAPQGVSEKVSEERLRDMSISAIKEFYSAKDEAEVALCIRELNSPGFYPSMISLWVTDSFDRKDMERDLLAKLLINLTRSHDSLLSEFQLMKGFESVFATLDDIVNDAPRAAEFLGRILAKAIIEKVISLREIGRLINEGGEEPGRLLEMGLGSDVLGSILEIIKSEKGDSVLKEIRASSNLKLEDFRPPPPTKSRKLEAFI